MKKKKLVLPEFKNEEEEHKFWDNVDLSEHYEAKDLQPFNVEEFLKKHQKPKTTRITMRVPTDLLKRYKEKAEKLDIPYQSLMKQDLSKGFQ